MRTMRRERARAQRWDAGRWRATRCAIVLCAVGLFGAVAASVISQEPQVDRAAVTYSYTHAPDEPGWDGVFRDPNRTKLLDGVAGGKAQHSVIWAATTDERFIDVDLGSAVALDRVVVRSYKHYTGRDFQIDDIRLYLSDTAKERTWKQFGEQRGYAAADEQGIRDFTFAMPEKPLRRFRIGLHNADSVRLALSEIEVYAREDPDISYTILANFEEVAHAPEGPPPAPTAEGREAGYVLFAPSYLRRVFPNSAPLTQERVASVPVTASLGEYEPLTVAVYPLQELGRCTLRVTDLVGPGDARIGSDNIDVRTVRHWRQIPGQKGSNYAKQYMLGPELLEPSASTEVKARTTRQWWITVRVPQDATPGEYAGTISIEAENGHVRRLGLSLRVLPLRLECPEDYSFGMYWEPWPSGRNGTNEDRIIAQLRDMREHGMNSVALTAPASMSRGENGRYEFELDSVTRALVMLKQQGFTRPIPWSHGFPPVDTGFGSDEHSTQVKAFVEHAQRHFAARELPEVLWYPRDEPWHDPRRREARVLCEAIKQVPGARTYTTVRYDTAEYLDRWLDVRCHTVSLNGGFEARKLREAAAGAGDLFWWYTNACREYPDVMRFKAGFFFWKTGATGQYYWAYQSPRGNPYDDLDGIDWCAAYPGDDGPIPTIEWEALREGIDDFRYVYTLERAIARARDGGSTEAMRMAKDAERLLGELRKDIVADLHEYEQRGVNFHTDSIWPPATYDDWRRRIAQMTVRIQSRTGPSP